MTLQDHWRFIQTFFKLDIKTPQICYQLKPTYTVRTFSLLDIRQGSKRNFKSRVRRV